MSLGDFFRINLPYGMKKQPDGSWFVFNREYKPLGFNTMEFLPIDDLGKYVYVKYDNLNKKKLDAICKLAVAASTNKNEDDIKEIFFYNDGCNPANKNSKPEDWARYFELIKLLSSLQTK